MTTIEIPNFRVAFQLADRHGQSDIGAAQYTGWANDTNNVWSEWAGDANMFDPDVVRIHLERDSRDIKIDKDFRFMMQAADNQGRSGIGTKQVTPWASEGGGWSPVVLDSNSYDPDVFRIKTQTREWNSDQRLTGFRLGLRLYDNLGQQPGPTVGYTGWIRNADGANNTGGWSEWVGDANSYDPDGLAIRLEVEFG